MFHKDFRVIILLVHFCVKRHLIDLELTRKPLFPDLPSDAEFVENVSQREGLRGMKNWQKCDTNPESPLFLERVYAVDSIIIQKCSKIATAPGIPRRSPIQVLAWRDSA